MSPRQRRNALDACVKWTGRICVTFVWVFCAVGYWAVWHYVFIPYMMYTGQEPFHIIILTFFHFLVALCLYCYYCATRTDPGYVVPGYLLPEMEEGRLPAVPERDEGVRDQLSINDSHPGSEEEDEETDGGVKMELLGGGRQGSSSRVKGKERIKDTDDSNSESEPEADDSSNDESEHEGGKRKKRNRKERKAVEVVEETNYCKKCSSHRPPRAHHCRHCNRCVLRMDHHCPWINNCVGHNNLKYFVLFLVYGTGVGFMFLTLFGFCIYDFFQNSDKFTAEQLWTNGITIGVIVWVACALTLNLSGMGFHMFILVITNSTTIEKMSLRARLWRRGRSQKKLRHKYDLGPQANLRQVMGSSPLQWLFPTPPETDGYHSPTFIDINNQYELW